MDLLHSSWVAFESSGDLPIVHTTAGTITMLSYDLGVSDHKAISMDLPSRFSLSKPKRNICFRNLKNINSELLAADFQHLSTHFSSADEAVDYYSHLSSLLDLHAPVKTRTVTFTRSAPWFTDELRKMKAAGRVLERRLIASGLTNKFTRATIKICTVSQRGKVTVLLRRHQKQPRKFQAAFLHCKLPSQTAIPPNHCHYRRAVQ